MHTIYFLVPQWYNVLNNVVLLITQSHLSVAQASSTNDIDFSCGIKINFKKQGVPQPQASMGLF